jgi:hypothetical protein
LCIIEPNKAVFGVLMELNIDKLIKIYSSEEDLLPPENSPA